MKKRLWSVLLAICVIVVMAPVAMAASVSTETELADALQTGGTVTLADDIELNNTITIPAGVTVTLDLNGKTISQSKACTASYQMIENNGTLTIAGNGKLSFTDTGDGDPDVGWASYTIRNAGTLVVENGTIEHLGQQKYNANNAIFHYAGTTTINGGTISVPYSRSLRVWQGTATINGGTFEGQVWVQPTSDNCSLTITDGSFKPATYGNDGSSVFVTNDTRNPKLSVSGGEFATKIGCSDATKLAGCITGGTFSESAKNSTAEALINSGVEFGSVNSDGKYEIVPASGSVAAIGKKGYTSLQAAIDAAGSGDTVTVLSGIELTTGITVAAGDSITLDLNGNTVSMEREGTLSAYDQLIENKGNLTIKDSSEAKTGALTYKYIGSTVSTGFAANTITNKPGATLIVKSGTIENKTTTGQTTYAIDSITNGSEGGRDTTVIVEGGTIKSVKGEGRGVALRACLNSTTYSNVVTIHEGTIIGGQGGFQLHGTSKQANKADVTIDGGQFNGIYSVYSYFEGVDGSNVDVTIEDGEFNGYVFLYNPQIGSSDKPFKVEIAGGEYDSPIYTYTMDGNNNEIAIKSTTGGTFETEIDEAYIVDGYGLVSSGSKYVVKKIYNVTVSTENGTASASPVSGVEGTEVTLTATPDTGYQFKEWQVVSGGVTVTENKFTIGTDDVEIKAIFEIPAPTIISQPVSAEYTVDVEAAALTVSASVKDGGTLSYQWYSTTTESTEGGTEIDNATDATYLPATGEVGTVYYYCVVTNTVGDQTASVTTNAAAITVIDKVDAQTPDISNGLTSATYTVGDTAAALTVSASVKDGGTLSYQWYSYTLDSTDAPDAPSSFASTESEGAIGSAGSGESVPAGTLIDGANKETFTPSTETTGTVYYFCEVTNTNENVTGAKTAKASTNEAAITVIDKVNAQKPAITNTLESAVYTVGDTAAALTVEISAGADDVLSYQWYSNTTESTEGGTKIDGATANGYTPVTDKVGKAYYYCVVTSYNANATGDQYASATSNAACITVNDKVNAKKPVITVQPVPAVLEVGNTTAVLTVTASAEDGGVLSYQWYSSATEATTGGTAIAGATKATYQPATDKEGKVYYYCVVTNTNEKATGEKTASVTSNAAAVTVEKAIVTHIADITVIGQKNASYINVHATLIALGDDDAVFEEQALIPAADSSSETEKYVYHSILKEGLYNLIVEATEQETGKTVTVTTLVKLDEEDDYHTVNLPETEKSSLVEVGADLGVIAGNVDEIAKEQEPENENGHLEVKLTVNEGYNPTTKVQDERKIEQKAEQDGKEIEKTFDIDLSLIQYNEQDTKTSEQNLGNTNTKLIEILIPIETEDRKPEGFAVYRMHDGELHALPYEEEDVPRDYERFVVNMKGKYITLYVKHFSSYAIGYGEKVKPEVTLPAADQTVSVTEGDVVTLSIVAKDAVSYQWQINFNDGTGWHARGENEPSYTSSPTTLDNNGYQYKCVVTSADGLKAESPIFTLEVVKKVVPPQTGDDSHIGLWLALMCTSLAGITMLFAQRKRNAHE